MQENVQFLQAGIATDFRRQGITVHFRHFDVGDQHQQLVFRTPSLGEHVLQVLQGLAPVVERGHFHADRLQATDYLLARHRRIVHHQHPLGHRAALGLGVHHSVGHFLGRRCDLREHFFHVDDFHQLLVHPGHRGQVMLAAGALGWRMDLFPVHVDDALHRAHQEALHLGVVLGDDREAVGQVLQPAAAGGQRQGEDRNGASADVRHPAHHRAGLGHHRQARALQHLFHLEHVDAVELVAVQAEQKQLQTVLSDQLRTLVD